MRKLADRHSSSRCFDIFVAPNMSVNYIALSFDFIFKPARDFCEKFQKKLGCHIFKIKICVNLCNLWDYSLSHRFHRFKVNSLISSRLNPVITIIVVSSKPFANIFRAISRLRCDMPFSMPSALPFSMPSAIPSSLPF